MYIIFAAFTIFCVIAYAIALFKYNNPTIGMSFIFLDVIVYIVLKILGY